MKIKHWQGYGSVNAKVVEKTKSSIVIEVTGDHEWGLVRNDAYDIKTWLLAKVAKDWVGVPSYLLSFVVYAEGYRKATYCVGLKWGLSLKEALLAH